jgi:hypothetical protein
MTAAVVSATIQARTNEPRIFVPLSQVKRVCTGEIREVGHREIRKIREIALDLPELPDLSVVGLPDLPVLREKTPTSEECQGAQPVSLAKDGTTDCYT